MSERSSFVTDYVYCRDCFEAAKKHLLDDEKYLCSRVAPSWQAGEVLPIISGKLGDTAPGGELVSMDESLMRLSKEICHELRVAVLSESRGAWVFFLKPGTVNAVEVKESE